MCLHSYALMLRYLGFWSDLIGASRQSILVFERCSNLKSLRAVQSDISRLPLSKFPSERFAFGAIGYLTLSSSVTSNSISLGRCSSSYKSRCWISLCCHDIRLGWTIRVMRNRFFVFVVTSEFKFNISRTVFVIVVSGIGIDNIRNKIIRSGTDGKTNCNSGSWNKFVGVSFSSSLSASIYLQSYRGLRACSLEACLRRCCRRRRYLRRWFYHQREQCREGWFQYRSWYSNLVLMLSSNVDRDDDDDVFISSIEM